MPKPTTEHRRLERLAGTWRGAETMHPSEWSPGGSTAEGETRSRVALDGFSVIADYDQFVGGTRTFSGHGVYTIDGKSHEVVLYWFDSMGVGCEIFRGGWSGETLTVESRNPMMGRMRLTYQFRADGTLASSMERSADGSAWARMFDAVYTRVES